MPKISFFNGKIFSKRYFNQVTIPLLPLPKTFDFPISLVFTFPRYRGPSPPTKRKMSIKKNAAILETCSEWSEEKQEFFSIPSSSNQILKSPRKASK